LEDVPEEDDLGLEWELDVREGEWCFVVLALEIGEGEDLGIRTGVDISGEGKQSRLYRSCSVDGWRLAWNEERSGLGGWSGLRRLLLCGAGCLDSLSDYTPF